MLQGKGLLPQRYSTYPSSIMPRIITSSTWRKIQGGIADLAVPGSTIPLITLELAEGLLGALLAMTLHHVGLGLLVVGGIKNASFPEAP